MSAIAAPNSLANLSPHRASNRAWGSRTPKPRRFPLESLRNPTIQPTPRPAQSPAENESAEVQRAVAGDPNALNTLFTRYQTRMYRTAFRIFRNKEDAEDAVQDAMLSAFKNIASFKGESQFSTWLTRIVLNASLIQKRRRRCRPEMFIQEVFQDGPISLSERFVDNSPDPEQTLAQSETLLQVEQALSSLSPILRDAFEQRELLELSNHEAIEHANTGIAAFKSRISRARRQVACKLTPRMLMPLSKPYLDPKLACSESV